MFNRIQQFFARAPERGPPDTYFTIETAEEAIPVSGDTARAVSRRMRRFPPVKWISFRDVLGAELHLRASTVTVIRESSPALRSAMRAFYRAREKERNEDTASWDD